MTLHTKSKWPKGFAVSVVCTDHLLLVSLFVLRYVLFNVQWSRVIMIVCNRARFRICSF
jgi:hypothetical protein